jgi:hypothetical protein
MKKDLQNKRNKSILEESEKDQRNQSEKTGCKQKITRIIL